MSRVTTAVAVFLLAVSTLRAQDQAKPRVFVSDTDSWEQSGGFAAWSGGAAGASTGGARPQTAEVIKTLGERCPDVTVTMKADRADYVLLLEHEGGKGLIRKDNKFALFNSDGDALASGSTRTLGNAVKDACFALLKDWRARTPRQSPTPPAEPKS